MKVNTESCEYIVNKYKNLVYKLARRLNYGNALYEDLVQAGFMGLIYASNKFDFTKHTNFISFASIYIVSEMKKENSKLSIFKTSDHILKLKSKINKCDGMTLNEIAERVNTSIENVMLVQSLNQERISFNDIEDTIPSPKLNFLEISLTKEEYEIYKLRVINKYSQKEISKILNMSQPSVSRRLKELKNKISEEELYK